MRRELVRHSKFLSLILRHDPSVVGLELDTGGWIDVSVLLHALRQHQPEITSEVLVEIVETNDKRRFAFSAERDRIRASQGHSVGVDLGLPAEQPPPVLFHGTAQSNLAAIRAQGLVRGARDHVHLSPDEATARSVGARHGRPIVLHVEAGKMAASGFTFHVSANGVWLTAYVPPAYLLFPDSPDR